MKTREELIKDLDFATKAGDLELSDVIAKQIRNLPEPATAKQLLGAEPPRTKSDFDRLIGGDLFSKAGSEPAAIRYGKGAAETALSMISGIGTSALGGLYGLMSLPFGSDTAAKNVHSITDLTYVPKSEEAKNILSTAEPIITLPSKVFGFVGDVLRGDINAEFGPKYSAYDWGGRKSLEERKKEGYGFGDTADAIASIAEISPDFALALYGISKTKPGLNPIRDPRQVHAESRMRAATEDIPASDIQAGKANQAYAASRGKYLSPTQALDREYPMLSQLEAQIRGSKAPGASGFRELLKQQPQWIADLVDRIKRDTKPNENSVVAAGQMSDAAKLAIGEIERTPNAITSSLYEAARTNPGTVNAPAINRVLAGIRKLQAENRGDQRVVDQLYQLIDRIRGEQLNQQAILTAQQGRPVPLDQVGIPSNVADKLAVSFRGEFSDLAREKPSLMSGAEATIGKAAGLLKGEAMAVSSDLQKATAVNRALRPDFSVSRFDPLTKTASGGSDAVQFITRQLGSEKVDPAAFRVYADRIYAQDPNAFTNALGNYVSAAKDAAFKTSTTSGKFTGQEGIAFANSLIGTNNKREAFRIALTKYGEGANMPNPVAFADGTIKLVELVRNMSREVGTDLSRAAITAPDTPRAIKIGFGNTLMARSAFVSTLQSFVNRFSDNFIAETMQNPRNLQLLTAAGQSRTAAQSNARLLALISASISQGDNLSGQ